MLPDDLHILDQVSLPTLGHFLEDGFCAPELHLMTPAARMQGLARTVRVVGNDAISVNEALSQLEPGEVLVVEMADDHRHAPIGAVTRAAALARGAAGIVVDGPVTDIEDLRGPDRHGFVLPVYARGTTCLTTKRHDAGRGQHGVDLSIAGTAIDAGDVVLGDENGVVALPAHRLRSVLPEALASDAAEPAVISAIESGAPPPVTHEVRT